MSEIAINLHEVIKPLEYKDNTGNLWRELPNGTKLESFLGGSVNSRVVVTPEGQKLYADPSKLLKRLESGSFVEGLVPLARGGEGTIRKVNDAPFRAASWLGLSRFEGVVKNLQGPMDTPLLGWETIQAFDAIRPAFASNGINLLTPFAGTDRKIYSPFIKGTNVEKFFARLPAAVGSPLRKALRERAEALHKAIHPLASEFLSQRGLTLEKAGDQLVDNIPDLYTNPHKPSEVIRMLVDVCPGTNADNWENNNRFRNWVMPQEGIEQIEQVGSYQEALDIMTSKAVVVDPIMIMSASRSR